MHLLCLILYSAPLISCLHTFPLVPYFNAARFFLVNCFYLSCLIATPLVSHLHTRCSFGI